MAGIGKDLTGKNESKVARGINKETRGRKNVYPRWKIIKCMTLFLLTLVIAFNI
jgi:hypothetical protein